MMYDIAIIGGGINGCGIARDAAGRGYKVCLLEKNDLASGTSSASTKLIHGGLRYLEHYEFKLVRESLKERETLWKIAPHIIKPMQFILPHQKHLRPKWLIQLGLFLYDHIGTRQLLPKSKKIDLSEKMYSTFLDKKITTGFEYADCWVDDARLVILNVLDAKNYGADIDVRSEVKNVQRKKDYWQLDVYDHHRQCEKKIEAKIVINAAGAWVENILKHSDIAQKQSKIRLVKGSHIVTKKLFDFEKSFIFQNRDQRIIFAIPYEDDFTLIGTTDVELSHDWKTNDIDQREIDYLINAINEYTSKKIDQSDIVWSYSGIRSLFNDDHAKEAKKVTRDYVLDLNQDNNQAVLLSVFGGKLTTYRLLAEKVLEKLTPFLPFKKEQWTANSSLPGGDFAYDKLDVIKSKLIDQFSYLDDRFATRLIKLYGKLAWSVLDQSKSLDDLGIHFGDTLYQSEVEYLLKHEWAKTADDILWRRSKLGLFFNRSEIKKLEDFLQNDL